MFKRIKHVHFVGIGGIGMSGIAEVLLTLGYRVTGSDMKASRVTEALVRAGAEVFSSHRPENVAGAHVVVRSSAIRSDNSELLRSEALKIPVISRAEMLAELARLKYTIGVAGTHGKTTTTSMIATILDQAGMDPTFVIGGLLNTVGRNARLGKGEFIVLEADESDGSFLMLSPTIAVITNVEADHLDHYSGLPDIQDSFVSFANKVPFYGAAVLGLDSVPAAEILAHIKRPVVTFGIHEDADIRISNLIQDKLRSQFRLQYNGGGHVACTLQVPGEHNVGNAAAAFAATYEMGIDPEVIAKGLEAFGGVERRFQVKATDPYAVIDDYAHHPTEVRATIAAARNAGFRRILAAFEPHRYSRTYHLFEDFVHAFDDADTVLIADIYPAGERPIEGVTSRALVERMRSAGKVEVLHVPQIEDMEDYFREHVRSGDAILIMGAGNITVLADTLSEALPLNPENDAIKVSKG
jgi:UDP-N-acetylmuramate--alanine ligase